MAMRALLGVGGVGLVCAGGAGFVYRRRLQENRATTAEAYNGVQDQAALAQALAAVAAHAQKPSVTTAAAVPPIDFYRYTTCPFCGKVKAFLDYFQVPHTCIEVEPMFKGEIRHSTYKKVPQLRFCTSGSGKKDDASSPWLVDSDLIVDKLAPILGVPSKQLEDPDVMKWRAWARESLVRHLVMNINQSLVSAWQGYEYIDAFDTIPLQNKLFLKAMGAPVMYLVAQLKTKPALVKAGELAEGQDVKEVLHAQVATFQNDALSGGKPFHGGKAPDLADIDVYGVFQSIRGHAIYDDLYRSPKLSGLTQWLDRMDEATKKAPYQAR